MNRSWKWVRGGVPGGHIALWKIGHPPYVSRMHECYSIPIRRNDVVVDIGAYVGTYALWAARHLAARVTAYEPGENALGVLRMASGLPNLVIVGAAVTRVGGEIPFFVSRDGLGSSNSTVPSLEKSRTLVRSVKYADAVADATIVKIDVEGEEYDYPIADCIGPRLRGVIIEFHRTQRSWRRQAESIINEIEAAGFTPVIAPRLDGRARTGSWMREPLISSTDECKAMTLGVVCCGCGVRLRDELYRPAICKRCWPRWTEMHRDGFVQGVGVEQGGYPPAEEWRVDGRGLLDHLV